MEQEEKVVSFFRFEDLRVYGKAVDYAAWVLTQTAGCQNAAERTLAKTFYHSAHDIATNIAEGASRTKSQFDHYLKIAKTAIRECIVCSEEAHRIGVMNDEQHAQSREYLMELTRMLGALIVSLQRAAERRMYRSESDSDNDSYESPYKNDDMAY